MFNWKILALTALILATGASVSRAQIDRHKVAPLAPSERKLTRCELHGTRLQVGKVPIFYGIMSGQGASYYQASHKLFPHAHTQASGGCVISQGSPGLQAVKFCTQCRAAEKRWRAAHKMPGGLR